MALQINIYSIDDRYIGKTNNLMKRKHNHKSESKVKVSKKHEWIRGLLEKNGDIKLELIDVVPANEWKFWEKYWISQFKAWGFDLFNETAGGVGGGMTGKAHSIYSRNKIRRAHLGRKLSDSHKKSISKAMKGREQSETHVVNAAVARYKNLELANEVCEKWDTGLFSIKELAIFSDKDQKVVWRWIRRSGRETKRKILKQR